MTQTSKSTDTLITGLREAVKSYSKNLDTIERTRRAIVNLGTELASLIKELPIEDVQSIGLGVRVSLRGTPTIMDEEASDLQLEWLPSIEEADFNVLPGATALYLEALGTGKTRFFIEVRSSPGKTVLAYAHDCLREKFSEKWLENIHGIEIVDGRAYLVNQFPDHHIERGPDARALLQGFLTMVTRELENRSRFNCGIKAA